jgi:hypothetical protein
MAVERANASVGEAGCAETFAKATPQRKPKPTSRHFMALFVDRSLENERMFIMPARSLGREFAPPL